MMNTLIKSILILLTSILSFSVGIFFGKKVTDREYQNTALKCQYQELGSREQNVIKGFDDDMEFDKPDEFGMKEETSESVFNKDVVKLSQEFIEEEKKKAEKKKKDGLKKKGSKSRQSLVMPGEDLSGTVFGKKDSLSVTGSKSEWVKLKKGKKGVSSSHRDQGYQLLSQGKESGRGKEQVKGKNKDLSHSLKMKGKGKGKKKSMEERTVASVREKMTSYSISNQNPKSLVLHKPGISGDTSLHRQGGDKKNKIRMVKKMKGFPHFKRAEHTVQVASYRNEEDAKKHVSQLKSKGYGAFYMKAMVKNELWHRVSVGVFSDRKSALDFQKELKREVKVPASFIRQLSSQNSL